MKIKVCGMKDPNNIKALGELPIDYMGMIFYARSPRNFLDPEKGMENLESPLLDIKKEPLLTLPSSIKKVGVVVKEMPNFVGFYIRCFDLDCVQLHGNENRSYCEFIKEDNPNTEIIKVFSVSDSDDLKKTIEFEDCCDYFLFDTKTPQHGGSGKKFDWEILEAYQANKPFFLSGGISIDDVEAIKRISHPQLYALDLNSRFEIEPGLKNIDLLNEFIIQLKDE